MGEFYSILTLSNDERIVDGEGLLGEQSKPLTYSYRVSVLSQKEEVKIL